MDLLPFLKSGKQGVKYKQKKTCKECGKPVGLCKCDEAANEEEEEE